MSVSNWLRECATAGLVLACGSAFADQTFTQFEAGGDLTPERAATLEARLAQNSEDTNVRAQLLGFYSDPDLFWDRSARGKRHEHTLWFVRNAPESEVLAWEQDIDPCDDPAA